MKQAQHHAKERGSTRLRPLKKENLGSQVFEQLKGMILRGEIPPGRRIIESEIALFMGISRTPVREAVHKLEAEGLLTPLSKGGYAVRGLTVSDIEDTFDIRGILESFVGYLAAKRHTEGELIALELKIDEFQQYLDKGDLKKLSAVNTEFHEALYELSRSHRLIKMIHGLKDEIFFLRNIILNSEKMARLSNRDHKEIVEAIRQRDAEKAEGRLKEHILRGKEFVLNEIKKGTVSIGSWT
jgi:DNA-binding GntR family transcriptional regulator